MSDLEVARSATLRPIEEIAAGFGLLPDEVEPRGQHIAKVRLAALDRVAGRPAGRSILVTAMTPAPSGEGKTTTAIGLAQALNRIGVRAAVTLRQPSLGPVFGTRGGAAGGGRCQVVPLEAINLHLTGDSHAVTLAQNLAAAFLDNHLARGNPLGIDPAAIDWPRTSDINDRALEGLTPAGWVVAAASETMGILSLARDLPDLRARLGRAVVGRRSDGTPVTMEDLHVAGAMAALLRDALGPNLLQTLEGGPALVHGTSYAHLALGSCSVVADRLALRLADAVVTESGYGADLGAEKYFDIKCRGSGLVPSAAVLVATVRGVRTHGPENLAKQIENVRLFGVPVVVAVNPFPGDTAADVKTVTREALRAGARDALVGHHHAQGGEGAIDLARAVWSAAGDGGTGFQLLYPDDLPLAEKIETIARRVYGAAGVDYSLEARGRLAELEHAGFGGLPICIAKTPYSLSHDPALAGRPIGFRLPVRGIRLAAGAGYVTAAAGDLRFMPGLPERPGGEAIDIDAAGDIVGLA